MEDDTSISEYEDILNQVEAKTDDVSKNFIYVKDKNNNIRAMMVEVCNTETNNMDYVTIPIRTRYTIPMTLYQKLVVVSEEIPQVVKVSRLRHYFPEDMDDTEAFGYISIIMEKALGTEKSYYTVMNYKMYSSRYKKQKTKIKFLETVNKNAGDTETTSTDAYSTNYKVDVTETTESAKPKKSKQVRMAIHVPNDDFKAKLLSVYGDESKTMSLIKEDYNTDGYFSNLNVFLKIGYVESYLKTDPNYFHYWGVPSRKGRDGFFKLKTDTIKKMFKSICKNETTYTTEQFSEVVSGSAVTINMKSMTGGTIKKTKEKKKDKDKTSADESDDSDDSDEAEEEEVIEDSKEKKILVLNGTDVAGL
ncbi:MAG: hypothetical protein K6G11_02765, partial [Lachnospiraceae bacterium]|nr:hypothetical protein [Lachnospiraceae bacterium]